MNHIGKFEPQCVRYARKRRQWLAIFGFIVASVTALTAASIPVQSYREDADGVTLTMSPGKMKLTVCSDSIVRVMYSPNAALPVGQDFAVKEGGSRSRPKPQ